MGFYTLDNGRQTTDDGQQITVWLVQQSKETVLLKGYCNYSLRVAPKLSSYNNFFRNLISVYFLFLSSSSVFTRKPGFSFTALRRYSSGYPARIMEGGI